MRVFFALVPSQSVQNQLASQARVVQKQCGGRVIPEKQIHLTLLFLGNVAAAHIKILKQVMDNVAVREFAFDLNQLGYWKRNQILYAHAPSFPDELFLLAESLWNAILDTPLKIKKYTFTPHVTLIRKANQPDINYPFGMPIHWSAKHWLLMQSKQTEHGVEYILLGKWNLRKRPSGSHLEIAEPTGKA